MQNIVNSKIIGVYEFIEKGRAKVRYMTTSVSKFVGEYLVGRESEAPQIRMMRIIAQLYNPA